MAYLASLLVVAGGVLVLAALVVRAVRPVRTTARSARDTRAAVSERAGLLTARAAALRVEFDRRRNPGAVRSDV